MPLGYVKVGLWNDSNTTKEAVGNCTSQNDFFKITRPPLTSIINNPLIGDFGGTLKNLLNHSPSACDICKKLNNDGYVKAQTNTKNS